MATSRQLWIVVVVLWCAVLGSASASIYTRHRSRELFVVLERLRWERNRLDVTWGQLQLEQSTFSAHAQVEAVATGRLKMVAPDPARIQLVTP